MFEENTWNYYHLLVFNGMDKKFLQIRNPFPDVRNERHDDKREEKGW